MKSENLINKIAVIAFFIFISFALISCSGLDMDSSKKEDEYLSTQTTEVTRIQTPTPEPTSTPVPEGWENDLLHFTADFEHTVGDTWKIIDGKWSGPLVEPQCPERGWKKGAKKDGLFVNMIREVVGYEFPDGTKGPVIRQAIDGDEGYRLGTTRYGIEYAGIKPETKYTVAAVFRLTGSQYISGNKDSMTEHVVLGYAVGTNLPSAYVELEFKDEWQTVEFEFETGKNVKDPNIVLGVFGFTGAVNYDYEMLIRTVVLYES